MQVAIGDGSSDALRRFVSLVWISALMAAVAAPVRAAVVYSTGFEPATFQTGFSLVPQGDWTSDPNPSGGDQVVTNWFEGRGQQALIGFFEPTGNPASVSLWKPLNYDPVAAGLPVVTFKVAFAIYDCTTNNLAFRDFFRWSVYSPSNRLFTIEFDNATTEIWYQLDDNSWTYANALFERADLEAGLGLYDLAVTMDFAHNQWSATLNDAPLATARQITTKGGVPKLGDIDAVWVAARNEGFGDNYMVFDDYRVEANAAAALPFRLETLGPVPGVGFALQLHGEEGRSYSIEATTNFLAWTALKTNAVSGGVFDYVDREAVGRSVRFYRARAL